MNAERGDIGLLACKKHSALGIVLGGTVVSTGETGWEYLRRDCLLSAWKV